MKYRQIGFVFLVCFFSVSVRLCAQPSEEQFMGANQYYHNGEYEKALKEYLDISEHGTISGNLFYNIANTYYKLGRIGYALLYYERAKRLMPYDEDLFENAHFLSSLIKDAIPIESHAWYVRMHRNLRDLFGWKIWLIVICLLYFSAVFLAGISIYTLRYRSRLLWTVAFLSIFVLLFSCLAWDNYRVQKIVKNGVVVVPEINVRYSPSYEGAVAFKVHEGISMQIIRSVGEWRQIRLSKGKSGWVPDSAMEEI
ncbi:MAG: SH3 domain-containing protein [Chlamydiota bacterium]|nr:SH3 domain-containing protein [Chlamydiota bacterium]